MNTTLQYAPTTSTPTVHVWQTTAGQILRALKTEFDEWYALRRSGTTRWVVEDCEKARDFFGRAISQAEEAIKAAEINKFRLDLAEDQLMAHTTVLNQHSEALKRVEDLLKDKVVKAIKETAKAVAAGGTASSSKSSQPQRPVKPSYSQVTNPKTRRDESSGPELVILPKNPVPGVTHSATATQTALANTADPTVFGKGLARAIPARNGKVILRLQQPADVQRIRQTLAADQAFSDRFEVVEPKKRKPCVMLFDIPSTVDDDNLLHLIHTQNPEVKAVITDYQDFKQAVAIKLHLKNKRTNTVNVILEAPPALAHALVTLEHVRLQWLTVRCRRHILVTRCFNCCGLGHRDKRKLPNGTEEPCPNQQACSQCSENHRFKDCPYKPGQQNADPTKTCCPLCKAENVRNRNTALDTAHNAFSDSCPALTRYRMAEHNRTDYGC